MKFGKLFRNNSVLAAAVTTLCCVCISQTVQAESIVGWGRQVFDSSKMDGNFTAIAAGDWHSLALKSDGSIAGWGRDNYGQATPPAGFNYIAIAAGYEHSLALKTCPYNLIGDLNDDCEIDFRDFAVMAPAWRSSTGDINWNPACDISVPADGSIDERDLDIFTDNWLAGTVP